jgi:ketosteroid isomerase-like protein
VAVTVADVAVARRAFDALAAGDVDAFAALLARDIEIVGGRGPRHGVKAARAWATPSDSRWTTSDLRAEEVRDLGEGRVLVLSRLIQCWADTGEVGDDTANAYLFTIRDGRVVRCLANLTRERAEAETAPS